MRIRVPRIIPSAVSGIGDAVFDGDFLCVAYGPVIPQVGSAAPTLDELVCAAEGARGAIGSANPVFAVGDEFFATGFGYWDPPSAQGVASTSLGAFVAVITGSQGITGFVAALLSGDFVAYALGRAFIEGSAAITLDNYVSSVSGFTTVYGVGDATNTQLLSEVYGYHPGPVSGFAVAFLTPPTSDNPCQASGWAEAYGTVITVVNGINLGTTLALPLTGFASDALGTVREPFIGIGTASFNDATFVGAGIGRTLVTSFPLPPNPIELGPFVSACVARHVPVVFGQSASVGLPDAIVSGQFTGGAFGVFPYTGTVAVPLDDFVQVAYGIAAVRGQAVDVPLDNVLSATVGLHAPAILILGNATLGNFVVTDSFGIAWVIGNSGYLFSPAPAELFGSFGQLASPRNFGRHITPIFGEGALEFPTQVGTITPAWQVRYVIQGVEPIRAGDVITGNTTKSQGTVLSDFMFGTIGRLVLHQVAYGKFTYNVNTGPVTVPFINGEPLMINGVIRGYVVSAEQSSSGPNSVQTQIGNTRHFTFQDFTIFTCAAAGIACIITDPMAQDVMSISGQFTGAGVGARGNSGFMYNYAVNNLNIDELECSAVGVSASGVGAATIAGEFVGQGQGRWEPAPVPTGEGAAILPMPTATAFGITTNGGNGFATINEMVGNGVGWTAASGAGAATIVGELLGDADGVFVHPLQIGCVACEVPGTPVFITGIFTFHFETTCIAISPNVATAGTFEISCAEIYDACQRAQASAEGIAFDKIAVASGLTNLTPDVQVALTVELLGSWHVCFADGLYQARITGGNLTGGPGGPIAYTPGVQVVMVQAASAMLVNGGFPSADEVATAVWSKPLPLP